MEIEVGEYVRTKDGYIAKLIKKDETSWEFDDTIINSYDETSLLCGEENCYMRNQLEVIVKHSKNIIDLIEVGDFVEYIDGDSEYIKDFIIKKHTPASLISLIEYLKAYCKVIAILTHEQYEQNSYKIGE